jgi:Ran GTPase-activating protein (RanGAP) involved in mRNA processing and transport
MLYKFKINYDIIKVKGGMNRNDELVTTIRNNIINNTNRNFQLRIPAFTNKQYIISQLIDVISENNIIETLEFVYGDHPDAEKAYRIAESFADIIRNNTTITTLNIQHYNLRSDGTSLLVDALNNNNTITNLRLPYNSIIGEGVNRLFDFLQTNQTIRKLDLEGNDINDRDIEHLAEVLKLNNTLTHLNLKSNGMINKPGNNAITALANALTTNTSLIHLDIRDNNITRLPSELSQNRTLRQFLYTDNPIDYIPPNVERWLNRFENQENIQNIQIQNDSQNVHNRRIQQSTLDSYNRIINATPGLPPKEEIIKMIHEFDNDEFNKCEGLKSFLLQTAQQNLVQTTLQITFAEALWYVFKRIEINPSKNEIIKILCEDYVKSGNIDKCFIGSITRLINALNGFDPLVIINLETEYQKINRLLEPIYNKFINQENDEEENTSSNVMTNKTEFENEAIEVLQQNGIEITPEIMDKYIKPLAYDL